MNIDVEEEIKKPSVYSVQVRDETDQYPRQSVYSVATSNRDIESLQAKKRQSMTRHNHDFEILDAIKRRSTINNLKISQINEKKESIRSDITENIEDNNIDSNDEKAELGNCFAEI